MLLKGLLLFLTLTPISAFGQTEQVVYDYRPARFANPSGSILLMGGSLYGSAGVAYVLEPPSTQQVICSTCISLTGLARDLEGNLYGVDQGGLYNRGQVVEISASSSGWTSTSLYSFTGGADGDVDFNEQGSLIVDPSGNVYGTTYGGGNNGCLSGQCGVVFELSKNAAGMWVESVLHAFTGVNGDGANPAANLVFCNGRLCGTTFYGGVFGVGTVFELSQSEGVWHEATLHSFNNAPSDGQQPESGVVLDKQGNIYGTTLGGGTFGVGTVYELSPPHWTITLLHSFGQGGDGKYPSTPVAFDRDGNLWGTTASGGTGVGCSSCGTVFELKSTGATWQYSLVHSFSGPPDGETPLSGLVFDSSGNGWGTTFGGGIKYGGFGTGGTLYRIIP